MIAFREVYQRQSKPSGELLRENTWKMINIIGFTKLNCQRKSGKMIIAHQGATAVKMAVEIDRGAWAEQDVSPNDDRNVWW